MIKDQNISSNTQEESVLPKEKMDQFQIILDELQEKLEEAEKNPNNKDFDELVIQYNTIISEIATAEGVLTDERLDQLSGAYKIHVLENYCGYNDGFFQTYHTANGDVLELHPIDLNGKDFYVLLDESCGEIAEFSLFANRETAENFINSKMTIELAQKNSIEQFKGFLTDNTQLYVDILVVTDPDDTLNYAFDIALRNKNDQVMMWYIEQPKLTEELAANIELAAQKILNTTTEHDIMDFCDVDEATVKQVNQTQER
ncbi:MAG: hypothetical protein ACRDCC_08340 [Culicoidibacterales bacterium]